MNKLRIFLKSKSFKQMACLVLFCVVCQMAFAQGGGNAGIQAAATEVKGYISSITTLAYAIGGVVGLVGGIRIYIKWSAGDEVNKELMGWGGAFIFLMIAPTVVNGFFG